MSRYLQVFRCLRESRRLPVFRCLPSLLVPALAGACLLLAAAAQEPPADESPDLLAPEDALPVGTDERIIPPDEPMTPREELFLAIELRDVNAARKALVRGAGREINTGNPSPLATAALHNDLRMVVLLLDFGGDPDVSRDSPLEEAIRNENTRMVELLMVSGGRVPTGTAGQELFRLAQRGSAATELSRILLDNGAGADLCLAAATAQARIELMKLCLSRGADADSLPAELNALSVALAAGEPEVVDLILDAGVEDRLLAGAFADAVAAGRMDLVRRALTAGAVPVFEHIEAAIESGEPEICLFLLDQSFPDAGAVLGGGDVEALIQRTADLGFVEIAAELERRSGNSGWTAETWLPPLLGALAAIALSALLLRNLGRRRGRPPARAPAQRPPARAQMAGRKHPAAEAARAPAAPPAIADLNPAATLPIGALRMTSSAPDGATVPDRPAAPDRPATPGSPAPVERPADPRAGVAPEGRKRNVLLDALPAVSDPVAPPGTHGVAPAAAARAGTAAAQSDLWQVAPEPPAEVERPAAAPRLAASSAAQTSAVELRMPEVDLSRDAGSVFEAARKAGSGETVRPDAPDQRQVVLVMPSRVTMLHSCPAAGSLAPQQLAAAERLVAQAAGSPGDGQTERAMNVAAIAYTDLDAMSGDINRAIPFFGLLRKLAYLGHAVWIFEGHVSAMAAGCFGADVLIVDDGMMPYLPGNWRSVATRVMRGSDIYLFERKIGSLRRLT